MSEVGGDDGERSFFFWEERRKCFVCGDFFLGKKFVEGKVWGRRRPKESGEKKFMGAEGLMVGSMVCVDKNIFLELFFLRKKN